MPVFSRMRSQGTLDAVVDAVQHPGAELHRQRKPRGDHGLAHLEARGVLVHLDEGGVPIQADDLPHQALVPHLADVVHPGPGHALGDDGRARNLLDDTLDHLPSILKLDVKADGLAHQGAHVGLHVGVLEGLL
jgi:hypothetical protein